MGLVWYGRTFSAARVGSAVISSIESDASVANSSTRAHEDLAGFHLFVTRPDGRRALARAFQSVDTSGLVISHVRLGTVRPLAGTSGWEVDVRFMVLKLPTEAHIAMFTANRFEGRLMMMGAPGRALTHATVVRLAQGMTRRFNAAQPPKNLTAPTITGVAAVGQTVIALPGTWSNAPTGYRYQWGRCTVGTSCSEIQGATRQTYVPTAADAGSTLVVWVTAINANGARNAVSAQTAAVAAPPTAVEVPVVTGTPVLGAVLTAGTGTWTGAPVGYLFGWERCDAQGTNCVALPGNTSTYTLTAADVGSRIVALVVATNAAGSTTVTSLPTAVISAS